MIYKNESFEIRKKIIILQYIQGIVQFLIHYSLGGTPLLVGFIDLKQARNPNDWNSIVSNVFNFGTKPVTWACKKQCVCVVTSTEAKH